MSFRDYYQGNFAYDPLTNRLVGDAPFTVHLPSDVAGATPLAVTEAISGAPITSLRSNSVGALVDFAVEGEPPQIILRTTGFATKLTSIFGAVLAAGLDPVTVQKAIAAADRSEAAATRAERAASGAGGGGAGLTPEPGMSGYYLIGD